LSVILLIGVLIAGTVVKGSSRWFEIGFLRFQPVEIAKIALAVFLASWLRTKSHVIRDARYFLLSGLFALVPMVLTILQPDLGSALVLGFIWLAMISAAKPRPKHLAIFFLAVCAVSLLAWFFMLQDYQKNRIETFLNPASDPDGQGYNAIQAITAVGSGGLTGRGFARGVVSQLRFLPERQTDFIFASMGEELGFLGSVLLLTILLIWYIRMLRIIESAPENFGFFLSFGLFAYLFFQSAVNIAMNIGLLPITGIPLPLVSYGGSSLLVSLIAIGILQSIHIRAISGHNLS
jgi:rod shape determining protein RodA